MSDSDPPQDELSNVRIAYEQICSNHRAIDDFRAKLLGLLPLASGTGIFLLLSDAFTKPQTSVLPTKFLLPIGAFGFAVTLGLYFYELRGIQYCTHLIAAGKELERQLKVPGRFTTRPTRHVAGCISELSAAHLIYATVLSAWTFVAAVFSWPWPKSTSPAVLPASLLALGVFGSVIGFALRVNLRPPGKPSPVESEELHK